MNLIRRFQVIPPYAYCRDDDCNWISDAAPADIEGDAATHVISAGHEVRCVSTRAVILRPAAEPAGVTS